MAKANQIMANEILGRPLTTEFWTQDAAKSIISIHKELTEECKCDTQRASEIIVTIWNAACEEYGE